MATYIFQGGTANNIWGHSGNWNPNVIPTGADDAVFNALSPGCTVSSPSVCLGVNFTGYGNTLTFISSFGSGQILIGASGLTLSSSMGITCIGSSPGFIMTRFSGNNGSHITSNGKIIPRLSFSAPVGPTGGVNTYTINGTCTISEGLTAPAQGAGSIMSLTGGTISLIGGTAYWRAYARGSSVFLLNPPPGRQVTWEGGISQGAIVEFQAKPFIINAPGATVNFRGVLQLSSFGGESGSIKYVAGNVNTNGHTLILTGNVVIDTGPLVWNEVNFGYAPNVYEGSVQGTGIGNMIIGGTARFGSQANSGMTFTSGTAIFDGSKFSGETGSYIWRGSGIINIPIRITGTGTRIFNSTPGSQIGCGNLDFNIAMASGTCIFATGNEGNGNFTNCTFRNTSPLTTIIGTNNNRFSFGGTVNLNLAGVTLGTGSISANSTINIQSPVYFNNLLPVSSSQFSGPFGWTARNFTHPGSSTITLGTTGTYTVTSNFQMLGTNGTAGRAVLQSDTRADFLGTVNNNTLTFTSGTVPFIGGEVSMAQSYYSTPAAIPQGFAVLLPARPTVISGGPLSFNISPGVNPATGGTFSVGKKAKFFLGTGATQTVLWATTRDIDSLGPGGLYQAIAPQQSFNDTAGVTGPTLLRTLNWGTLAPPTRPAAFTFVT